ncbi:MAG: hypothetical protein J7L19_03405 [Dehalococcoidia bacterium]|nr:hypothetical protein [Dehalococcoidia bacterium]
MSNEELLDEIKSRGYWRVEIRSTEYQERRLPSRRAIEDSINKATVSLRGWPYPYFSTDKALYDGKALEGKVDWGYHKEYWRLYKSGQWLHYLALDGAWISRKEIFKGRSPLPTQHSGYLHVRGDVLFTLTEILRFAMGLAQCGVLDPTAFLSIQLHNTHDYMLYENPGRPWFFIHEYVNSLTTPIGENERVPVGELSLVVNQLALETATKVFEVFNWVPGEAGERMLAEEQKKLIERRL